MYYSLKDSLFNMECNGCCFRSVAAGIQKLGIIFYCHAKWSKIAVIATATNNYKRPHRRLCVSPTKLKPSLKDVLCYSESIYVSYKLNKLTPLHLWPLLGGILERKWEKAKKCLYTTDKKYTRCKRLARRVALEYCLKDSPCCTEWIDVCYKCIRDLIWISMEPFHGYTGLYKRARNSSFKNSHWSLLTYQMVIKQSLPL